MKKTLLLTAFAVLVGCGPTPQEVEEAKRVTKANAASPEVIMHLQDGRPVNRIRVIMPGGQYDHFVYYIDNAQVSTNYDQQAGKVRWTQPIVTLPANPTADQILAEAGRLQKAQEEHDRAEYKRLKEKYGN